MVQFRICSYSILLLLLLRTSIYAQSYSDILSYISQYTQIALEQERIYGIPAPITLAQGILESGAGKGKLATYANNHFGIKALGGWSGPVYYAWDDEPQKSRFRKYSSAAESYTDHSLLLVNSSRYSFLFKNNIFDYRSWAIGLQTAGYATAENYAKAIIGYIETYLLYEINGGAKLRTGKTVITSETVIYDTVTVDTFYIREEQEVSQEEIEFTDIINRFVVDINDVRCAVLYPGETISLIAMKYDIPKHKILEYNEVSDESSFHEGDIVFLQKKKKKYSGIQDYYTVKKDDTVYSISQMFGLTMNSLAKMNGKDPFSSLREGERLRLK